MLTLRSVLLIALILSLGACGFHPRGKAGYALPFQALYVQHPAKTDTPFATLLKHDLEAEGVQIVASADKAPLTLNIVTESMDKQILSLSSAGRVLEYRLQYRVSFRLYDAKQRDWIAPAEITLRRSYTYDDSAVLAKAKEEAMLYQDMRIDAVQQILRRLAHAQEPKQKDPQE
jgi:LPS-assembly lipoprotein